jgi:hypothetical protein
MCLMAVGKPPPPASPPECDPRPPLIKVSNDARERRMLRMDALAIVPEICEQAMRCVLTYAAGVC